MAAAGKGAFAGPLSAGPAADGHHACRARIPVTARPPEFLRYREVSDDRRQAMETQVAAFNKH